MVYRVLLSGIPTHLEVETFYDYLHAHCYPKPLYNALLVGAASPPPPTHANHNHNNSSSSSLFSYRNYGIALVDLYSKGDAEEVFSPVRPFYIEDSIITVQRPLGEVFPSRGSLAASVSDVAEEIRERGKAEYDGIAVEEIE